MIKAYPLFPYINSFEVLANKDNYPILQNNPPLPRGEYDLGYQASPVIQFFTGNPAQLGGRWFSKKIKKTKKKVKKTKKTKKAKRSNRKRSLRKR